MEGYRKLTVKKVAESTPPGECLMIDFADCVVSIQARKSFLEEKGLPGIAAGQEIYIMGKVGNSDLDLWGFDTVADMRPVQ